MGDQLCFDEDGRFIGRRLSLSRGKHICDFRSTPLLGVSHWSVDNSGMTAQFRFDVPQHDFELLVRAGPIRWRLQGQG